MHVVYAPYDTKEIGNLSFVLPVERYEQLCDTLRNQIEGLADFDGHKLAALGFNVALRALEVNAKDVKIEDHPCKQISLAQELVEALEDFTDTWEEPWAWTY